MDRTTVRKTKSKRRSRARRPETADEMVSGRARNEGRCLSDAKGDEMPKMKTHRGSEKRFRRTGTGKLKRNKAGKQHILTKKRTKRKRPLRQHDLVSDADAGRVKRSLPYL